MKYSVCRCSTAEEAGEIFSIESYPWGKDYCPKTTGSLIFVEQMGFVLKMQCEEANPTARYHSDFDPVHKDSCMEAFLNFYPELPNGYINFEINALGAMKCSIGPQRNSPEHPRYYFGREGISVPRPAVCLQKSSWEIQLVIPLDFLKTAYGKNEFVPGQILRGNFQKCGEETPIVHFGSLFPIDSPSPDFHRPDCFGALIIR